jgi:hypothetical protein
MPLASFEGAHGVAGAIAGKLAVNGTFTNAGVGERSRGVAELTSHTPRLNIPV